MPASRIRVPSFPAMGESSIGWTAIFSPAPLHTIILFGSSSTRGLPETSWSFSDPMYTRQQKDKVKSFLDQLGLSVSEESLNIYCQALTHSSYTYESKLS